MCDGQEQSIVDRLVEATRKYGHAEVNIHGCSQGEPDFCVDCGNTGECPYWESLLKSQREIKDIAVAMVGGYKESPIQVTATGTFAEELIEAGMLVE